MTHAIEAKLATVPDSPGVYQFKNEKGKVIYVGKARNLRNRVRSYFHSGITSAKSKALVSKIADVEFIVTHTEVEALVLENNLIKKFQPRYNILLKDDKSFPYIKVTNEPYPRIYPTRRVIPDGSKYFGPYTEVRAMRAALRAINKVFRIRSCKLQITDAAIQAKKFKVCLDFHIKKCDGPCEGLNTEFAYNEMVQQVIKLLNGKTGELVKELKEQMDRAAAALNFELAAETRDRLVQLEALSQKQKVVTTDFSDRDIIALAMEGKDCACSVFNIKEGRLIGKKQLRLAVDAADEEAEVYAAAVKHYYGQYVEIPSEVLMHTEVAEAELLEEWLTGKAGKKIKILVPQRGELRSLVKMCRENAVLQLKEIHIQRMKKEGNVPFAVSALQKDLILPSLPRLIECFDNSNIQGSDPVSSMVVFYDGKPRKSLYRKFIVKTVEGPDDFLTMHEVVGRRYKRMLEESQPRPDLIIIDGGKGQLGAAVAALQNLGITGIPIVGLAKRLEEVFFPGKKDPLLLSKTSPSLKLLQRVRDEAHRFAITFHRARRDKRTLVTELTNVPGIGGVLAQRLIKQFGSVEAVRQATDEQLLPLLGSVKTIALRGYFAGLIDEAGGAE